MDRSDRIRLEKASRTLWSQPESWPSETPSHVFFTHALHQLGALRFPGDWSVDISAIYEDARFDTVASSLREHCAYGRLVCALQTSNGSIVDKLPAHVWNTPDYVEWFATGKAPLILCYDDWHPLARIPQCWLFIEKRGLTALINQDPQPGTQSAETPAAVSPVSKTALDGWFQAKVKEVSAGTRPRPSKKNLYALAKNELGGHATRTRTDDLHDNAEGWKRPPGRPQKQRQLNGPK